jgi:hypothetical protein
MRKEIYRPNILPYELQNMEPTANPPNKRLESNVILHRDFNGKPNA